MRVKHVECVFLFINKLSQHLTFNVWMVMRIANSDSKCVDGTVSICMDITAIVIVLFYIIKICFLMVSNVF